MLCMTVAALSGAEPAATWQQAGWGGGGFYYATVHHPGREGVIYMGGDVNGVYKTEDNGRHWHVINNGIASYAVYAMAVSAREPEVVYAATEEGLSKSVDGGGHWRTLPHTGRKELRITGERKLSIRCIAVDPRDGKVVYAASPGGKIYKSTDGGETWAVSYEKKAAGAADGSLRIQYGKVTGDYFGDFALSVAAPPGAEGIQGIGLTMRGEGVMPKDCFLILKTSSGQAFRSPNLIQSFQTTEMHDVVMKASDFAPDADFVKKHPEAAGTAFTDKDWAQVNRLDFSCSGALPTEAYVVHFGRFFFKHGSGGEITIRDFKADQTMQTFGSVRAGAPPAGPVHSVAIASTDSSLVVAATDDSGLLLSHDAGRTWKHLPTPSKAAHATFDPANADVMYGAFFKNGLMKSTDGGKHWTKISKGILNNSEMLEMAVSPANPNDVHAIGAVDWNGSYYASHDAGASWVRVNKLRTDTKTNPTLDGFNGGTASLSAPRNLSISPHNPKEIFIAANWRPCLSTDGGATWTERSAGADISCITDIRFLHGRTYVTVMDEGTLMSEDGGAIWRQLWPVRHTPGVSGHDWRVSIDEINGATRILSTATPWYKVPTCVIRSEDGGATFQPITTGLPSYTIRPNTMWGQGHPRALAVDPKNPQNIYLGIDGDAVEGRNGGGLFKSQDGGITWSHLPQQPASRRMFYGLVVDPTNSGRLFWGACGANGGVHRSQDGGSTWEHVFKDESFIWNLHSHADGTLYCGGQQLWHSSDQGRTWTQLTHLASKRAIVGIETHPTDPQTMWVSAVSWGNMPDGAIYKTTDGGTTWQDITGGIPYVKPLVLRFNPAAGELWAGGVGLYKIRQ
ncbi:WD40/YVTN/BNR-like repeat-containing protein [Prosthecobacter vanneervenii]|uniref:Photosystem II stability/assembly factor-like uncharacterized protein n=1 Tax=Prosthecobacter vanneervenii TaxID=48466 RepID=A0A7W7YFU8_9BACT|nr:sialidase family protein [Prosthecobacter vanneervenii]MBB5035369.1 photosystem II stability/assembly factor-like uncharacterized protein [Prosthecobacter vanneervenii]